MSEFQQRCQIVGCSRAATTRCYCCYKSVCTKHLNEHIDVVRAQIDPLADAVNKTIENVQNLTIDQFIQAPLAKLNQWQVDMHKLIDYIYLTKRQEIDELVEINQEKFVQYKKQEIETMMRIQDEVKKLVADGDATSEQINFLKNRLVKIESSLACFHKKFLAVKVRPFEHSLVTVTSDLNKPSMIEGGSSRIIGNRNLSTWFMSMVRYSRNIWPNSSLRSSTNSHGLVASSSLYENERSVYKSLDPNTSFFATEPTPKYGTQMHHTVPLTTSNPETSQAVFFSSFDKRCNIAPSAHASPFAHGSSVRNTDKSSTFLFDLPLSSSLETDALNPTSPSTSSMDDAAILDGD